MVHFPATADRSGGRTAGRRVLTLAAVLVFVAWNGQMARIRAPPAIAPCPDRVKLHAAVSSFPDRGV